MAVASAGTVARRCCVTTSQKRTVPSLPSEVSMPGLPGTADRLTTAPGCPAAALTNEFSFPQFLRATFYSGKQERLGQPVASHVGWMHITALHPEQ